MGRLSWFVAGAAVGSFALFNTVYENELLKARLHQELRTIYRMKNFVYIRYL